MRRREGGRFGRRLMEDGYRMICRSQRVRVKGSGLSNRLLLEGHES